MDVVNHMAQGYLIGYTFTGSVETGIVSGIIMGIPDIGGKIQEKYLNDKGEFYNKVHNFEHWLSYVPLITIHILEDKLCHAPGKRWYAGIDYDKTEKVLS